MYQDLFTQSSSVTEEDQECIYMWSNDEPVSTIGEYAVTHVILATMHLQCTNVLYILKKYVPILLL